MKSTKPNKIIMEIQQADFKAFLKPDSTIPDVKVYITNTVRGRANLANQFITIPKFAFNKSWDYFIYYLSHELAHINDNKTYKHRGHNGTFYTCFKQLCPDNLQGYELEYKPRNASNNGIKSNSSGIG
jgi:hypothetical protein